MSIPKKAFTKVIIAQAAKTITNPIKAAVIVLLALSAWPLSPPDVIYLTPPQISMKKKIKAATIKTRTIRADTSPAMVIFPRFPNCPPGFKLRFVWASNV